MSSELLAAAAAIGRRLAAEAVWHEGRCSWIGAETDPLQPWSPRYRALGPHLYGGTAGVGLFLARLHAVTAEPALRRTALGALRHAVSRPPGGDGFHAGAVGVAWAAARVAQLLDAELPPAGRPAPPGPRRCPDVIHGAAGAVLGRLALGEIGEATAAGEDLLARANADAHGWSWKTPGLRYPRPLCGLSHGAAGIGWALVELFAATGDDRFRDAALAAFAYERSWFDPVAGTWPDHRLTGYRRGRPHAVASPAFGTWCHGEAGILLTRLRAVAVLGPHADSGDIALATAAAERHLAGVLPYAIEDLSLCHGLAGTAEALLCAGHRIDLAAELGRTAIERHALAGDWPCAAPGGVTPGLFRGHAGIGWFLLRLHDPRIPSPLAVDSSDIDA